MPVPFKLYLISDRKVCREDLLFKKLEEALSGGIKAVQLREKDLSSSLLLELAHSLRELTRKHGAELLINDRLDIALSSESDGVQIPEDGAPVQAVRSHFPAGKIGRSVHSPEGAIGAEKDGADFITFSPIFQTLSKSNAFKPQGLRALAAVCSSVKIPVFALGGITPENAKTCLDAGAYGVAAVGSILQSDRISQTIAKFQAALGTL